MSLESEVTKARKEIVSDGYEMSVGEILNLYRDAELVINPVFQRLFRWDQSQKTRFIESLLLGIPIPPIFVMQNDQGVWELIDGLQRVSTVLEFVGELRSVDGALVEASTLDGTRFIPGLSGKKWDNIESDDDVGIGKALQLQIKRARLRVEILKRESDPQAKYELFQRLNTGGSSLTPQEVRNCVAVMINPHFHKWLVECSALPDFVDTTSQTENALEQQMGVELALRFFAFRRIPYDSKLDVHEYLDKALEDMALEDGFPFRRETEDFKFTFGCLNNALGSNAFKKWNAQSNTFAGSFLMSAFEVIATGVSRNAKDLIAMNLSGRNHFVQERAKELWSNPTFINNSGAGVRGTTRLANLLPMASQHFKP